MKQELISVIIPVYNVEKYLKACIDSILCQNFKDYEIILVDDGSKDNTYEVAQELAKRDSRIIVIKNEKNITLAPVKLGIMKKAEAEKQAAMNDIESSWLFATVEMVVPTMDSRYARYSSTLLASM